MTLQYSLDEKDYLQHQLFIASQSPLVKRKRRRGRVIVPAMYFGCGIYFFSNDVTIGAIAFFLFAVAWFLFYPLWDKGVYVKYYKKGLDEHYKHRYGRLAVTELNEEYIRELDGDNEAKFSASEVISIDEIPGAIYVRLKTGTSVIIPASQINDSVRSGLKELAATWKVAYTEDQQWKWK